MGYAVKKKRDGKFTCKDFLSWPDSERWELINGEAYDMTPSPTANHQRIVGNLHAELRSRLKAGPCVAFIAPLDVVFDDHNVVQPDILVVCDKRKVRERIEGAPDMIVEVLSPATSLKDKKEKKALYERFGVREYVIVYPDELFVERYRLVDGKFAEPDILGPKDSLTLAFIEGIDIPLSEVFETGHPAA